MPVKILEELQRILQDVKNGKVSVEDALNRLQFLPYEKMDDILFDHHRHLRKGFPEVIYGKGKGVVQLKAAVKRLIERRLPVLITRIGEEKALELIRELPALEHDPVARAVYHIPKKEKRGGRPGSGTVLVVTAGTSDLPVAREACLTLKLMHILHRELIDVGVAGIHRLFSHLKLLQKASVIICIAGMEGALPSIVAGIVRCPVIAVPTSTGYGSNMNGLVPLLAMLNSCAPGVGVVNIDNGFGAAALAASVIWSSGAQA